MSIEQAEGTSAATQILRLREHIHDMKARYENLQWDAKVSLTKAESIQAEYMRLESLVDKLDKPQATHWMPLPDPPQEPA